VWPFDVREGDTHTREGASLPTYLNSACVYAAHRHGKSANTGAPRGIFRSQAEWVELLQQGGAFTVTKIGSVVPRNVCVPLVDPGTRPR
jgi:hypothetical protein